MNKKIVSGFILSGLLIGSLIPAYNYFENDNNQLNKNVVFEYNGIKVYESEMIPYINYYLKMNNSDSVETKNYAVDNYIRSVLLSKFAEDSGYEVKDYEIKEFIEKAKHLEDNGKFSQKKYDEFLKEFGLKRHIFEEEVRKDLLIIKLMEKVDDLSNIEPYYFDIIHEVLAQRRIIGKVKIDMNSFPVVFDQKLLQEKYNENKEKYRKPDFIIFSKNTYIHPLNQSDKLEELDKVTLETNLLYEDIKNTPSGEVASKLANKFKSSTMMLTKEEFYNLIGTKNLKEELAAGNFFIDNVNIDNGVITVYEITNITKGNIKSFSEAYVDLTTDYSLDFQIEQAYKHISDYGDIKNSTGIYFSEYNEETIDPLKNDKSELLYKLTYALPLNGIKLYYDENNQNYYFIQLKGVEKINLNEEQINYFKLSQNNMYKQFIFLSMYDSIKKKYNLVKYKKES